MKKKKPVGTPIDRVVWDIFPMLIQDFRDVLGHNFAHAGLAAWCDGVASLREYEWPTLGQVDVFRYKAYRQLEFLFKRHTFIADTIQQPERDAAAIEKFLQNDISLPSGRPSSTSVHMVLQRARKIAREILQAFDLEEAISYMKIGGKATFGGPREKAYIDLKLGDPKMFTCPSTLRKTIFDVIGGDPILSKIVYNIFRSRTGIPDLSADVLDIVPVPKSWKISRLITPMTLCGLFWSYGIGGVVEARLRSSGLDIRRLQEVHKQLAKRYSRTLTHVTADLTSASDSITRWLLNCILPREWYRMLKLTFVPHLVTPCGMMKVNTALPSGNAATFPVETLVFYCLVKAIGDLSNVKGVFSSYGDDLIYPRRIHHVVVKMFTALGLKINGSKTFVSSHFRESCGGDYYRGCDVRPALLPENTSTHFKGLRLIQYLYKILNALLERWDECEIQRTVDYIEGLIVRYSPDATVYHVPATYPATSGKRIDNPLTLKAKCFEAPISYKLVHNNLVFSDSDVMLCFKAIVSTPKRSRPVNSVLPYYWEWLRSATPKVIRDLQVLINLGYATYRGYHEGIYAPLVYHRCKSRKTKKEGYTTHTPLKEEGGPVVQSLTAHPWAVGLI